MSEEPSRPDQVRTVNDPRHLSNKTFDSYLEYIKAINDIGGPERYLELLDNAIASLEHKKKRDEKRARGEIQDVDTDDSPRFFIGSANRPNWLGKILAKRFPSFRPRPVFHLPWLKIDEAIESNPKGAALVPWLNVFEEWYLQERPPLTFQAFAEILIQLYTELVCDKQRKAKKYFRFYDYALRTWRNPSKTPELTSLDVLQSISFQIKPEFRDQHKQNILAQARRIVEQGSKQIGVPIR